MLRRTPCNNLQSANAATNGTQLDTQPDRQLLTGCEAQDTSANASKLHAATKTAATVPRRAPDPKHSAQQQTHAHSVAPRWQCRCCCCCCCCASTGYSSPLVAMDMTLRRCSPHVPAVIAAASTLLRPQLLRFAYKHWLPLQPP
jgi:hypothetical protein